jgi:hypothetical protein
MPVYYRHLRQINMPQLQEASRFRDSGVLGTYAKRVLLVSAYFAGNPPAVFACYAKEIAEVCTSSARCCLRPELPTHGCVGEAVPAGCILLVARVHAVVV